MKSTECKNFVPFQKMNELSPSEVESRFSSVRELGHSRTGSTLLSIDRSTSELTVIKSFKYELLGTTSHVNTFVHYVEAVLFVHHPAIVPFTAFCKLDSELLLFRKYVGGNSFETFSEARGYNDSMVFSCWKRILEIYLLLHQNNIVGTSIRPANIFMGANDNIFITDIFPIPHLITSSIFTPTPSYYMFLSPEFFTLKHNPSSKSDVWSLGVLLMTMIKLELPWDTKNIFAMLNRISNPDWSKIYGVTTSFKEMISSLLNEDPMKRPSITEMLRSEYFSDGITMNLEGTNKKRLTSHMTLSSLPTMRTKVNSVDKATIFEQGLYFPEYKTGRKIRNASLRRRCTNNVLPTFVPTGQHE